jgi:hypothetical protein
LHICLGIGLSHALGDGGEEFGRQLRCRDIHAGASRSRHAKAEQMPAVGFPVGGWIERGQVESIGETELQLVIGVRQIDSIPRIHDWSYADIRGLDCEFQDFVAGRASRGRRQARAENPLPQFQEFLVALPDAKARELVGRCGICTRHGEERQGSLAGALIHTMLPDR